MNKTFIVEYKSFGRWIQLSNYIKPFESFSDALSWIESDVKRWVKVNRCDYRIIETHTIIHNIT